MKVGLLQFKPEFGDVDANIEKVQKLLHNKNFDLLVLPELPNSGYLFSSIDELNKLAEEIPNGKFCNALVKICKEINGYIVSGICERSKGSFYNSAVLVSPAGEIKIYRKLQLFSEEKLWFKPGNLPLETHEIKGTFGNVKIGMMVCFDWIFPEITRTLALNGAQIICHPSNLVMQYCQTAMFTRALENHVFTITANRIGKDINGGKELAFTGKSVIVDPKGNYIYRGSDDKEECFIVDIDPSKALDKHVTKLNNVLEDRREEFYFN
ncbi:MAG: acyltransferase [Chlorobi bacterium]|nr:acyltransferase [Chlorobiota bacterium]